MQCWKRAEVAACIWQRCKYSPGKKAGSCRVNNENRGTTTISLQVRGNTNYFATSVVMLQGFNKLSGRYFIDEAEHRIDATGGYTTSLSMHKIQGRVTV